MISGIIDQNIFRRNKKRPTLLLEAMYIRFFKPLFDILLALVLLVLFLPLGLFVSIVLYFYNNGEVFFIQERPGLHSKPFRLIKFKTMIEQVDESGIPMHDELRLTSLGDFLRQWSLDELPQLINVLKGDISFVGPRPLLMEYLPLYDEEQKKRHLVKPGITGLAQINGRNTLEWKKRFVLDVQYVNNISATMDFKILITTIVKVLKKEGVSAEGLKTVEKFKGN